MRAPLPVIAPALALVMAGVLSGLAGLLAADPAREREQGAPALLEAVPPGDPEVMEKYRGELSRYPKVRRSRLARVDLSLLRDMKPGDPPYPLYSNLFEDVGFRIYVYDRIERYYGADWLASVDPVYDGRRYVDFTVSFGDHEYTGVQPIVNFRALGLQDMVLRRIAGTEFVAVIEADFSRWRARRTFPDYALYQPSRLVFSRPENAFEAEMSVRVDYNALAFDFVDGSVGYLVAQGARSGRAPKAFKTIDGGRHWRMLAPDLPDHPYAVRFANESVGWLLTVGGTNYGDVKGCAPCWMKTMDGGESWAPAGHLGLPSVPMDMHPDFAGSMYALVATEIIGRSNASWGLFRSADNAESWSLIHTFPAAGRPVRMQAREDALYIGFSDGTLSIIDTEGRVDAGMRAIGNGMTDFRAASTDVIAAIVQTSGGRMLIRTEDGGRSWQTVSEESTDLVAAPSEQQIVAVSRKGRSAPLDTAPSSDVVAYTRDAGAHWEESRTVAGLIGDMRDCRSVNERIHHCLLHERILTIRTGPASGH